MDEETPMLERPHRCAECPAFFEAAWNYDRMKEERDRYKKLADDAGLTAHE